MQINSRMVHRWHLVWFLFLQCIWAFETRSSDFHYPKELHERYLETLHERRGIKHYEIGIWGSWSSWSPCSRSCGSGVSIQSRECFSKRKRTRKLSDTIDGRCVGIYKRFQLCNTENCLRNSDFRTEQCQAFNKTPFNRRYYSWIPYFEEGDTCSLNCRAMGLNFYATLNQSVIDGTPCDPFYPKNNNDNVIPNRVCVEGRCMKVGCDGILGSGRILDACGICGGDNSTCRVISGVYSRSRLPFGYNLIATLPTKAENISIFHVNPSTNYLALREMGGNYVMNGPSGMNSSGHYWAGDTRFIYSAPQTFQGDHLFAEGPLKEPVDIMLFYQTNDPGIRYEYKLPVGSSYRRNESPGETTQLPPPGIVNDAISITSGNSLKPKKKNKNNKKGKKKTEEEIKDKKRRKRYMWTIRGFTPCSQTCGGGSQKSRIVCVKRRRKDIEVPHSYCAGFSQPREENVRCNLRPCPAEWYPNGWSSCSVTCGIGFQTRTKTCRQRVSPDITVNVPEESCEQAPEVTLAQICQMKDCSGPPMWDLSPWSACSSQCGLGTRRRTATCTTVEGPVKENLCKELKPVEEEICDMGSCATDTWFFSSWDRICSGPCGEGVQKRRVHCSGTTLDGRQESSMCPKGTKPSDVRTCEVTAECGGSWFTGPWSECDVHCGRGQQRRAVVCVTWNRSRYRITKDDGICKASGERPPDTKPCSIECEAEWFTSEWSQCSVTCGKGVQRREIKCLDYEKRQSLDCSSASKPDSRQTCSVFLCGQKGNKENKLQEEIMEIKKNKISAKKLPNDSSAPTKLPSSATRSNKRQQLLTSKDKCMDRMKNCHLVFKARLCKLKYYNKLCCRTCSPKQ